jgi:hypothetical protein
VQGLLLALFRNLDQENIHYCLLCDHHRLHTLSAEAELDLLVQAEQGPQLQQLLARLGFVQLPAWGHAPHRFFVAYDQGSDSWLKLDVITEIAYGRPVAALRTDLATHCLDTRQRMGACYAPTPECELTLLLLHCLLDKGAISAEQGERLQTLRQQVGDEADLAGLLARYLPPTLCWPQVAARIEAGDWAALVAMRQAVADQLAQGDRLGVRYRQVRGRLLRKLNHLLTGRRPKALTVALLAPDGGGKSTLAQGLQASFFFPVRSLYMGLYQKRRRSGQFAGLPGVRFGQRLAGQWLRAVAARYYGLRGQLVIFDRYDALLPSPQGSHWPQHIRRWLLAHAGPPPDLVVLLDAPAALLQARKGEHSIEQLEQQRQRYLQLRSHLPQLVVVDATQEADQVRRIVTGLIWRAYGRRQAGLRIGPPVETPATYQEGRVGS